MSRPPLDVATHLGEGEDPLRERVTAYYEDTWEDYRRYWASERDLGMHFGYWDATTRSHSDSLLNANRYLADTVGVRAGERVLDAGCGVGGSALWLAEQRGAEVVGITVVPRQVALAQRHAAERGLERRVRFELADYTRTPFPSESFDVVWAQESANHAAEPLAFYREAARLLRPGGRLVLSDGMRRRRPFDWLSERLFRKWADGWAVPDLGTAEEHLRWAGASGLTDVRLEDITAHGYRSLARLTRVVAADYPLNLTRRLLGRRSRIEQANTSAVFPLLWLVLRKACYYGVVSARMPAE